MTRTQTFLLASLLTWLVIIFLVVTLRPFQLQSETQGDKKLVTLHANDNERRESSTVKPVATDDLVKEIDTLLTENIEITSVKPITDNVKGIAERARLIANRHNQQLVRNDFMKEKETDPHTASSIAASTTPLRMNWRAFALSPMPPVPRNSSYLHVSSASFHICDANVDASLQQRLSDDDLKWCRWALSGNGGGVVVGKSYGKLGREDRNRYEQLGCNSVAKGSNPTCDDVSCSSSA
jgi:hypothetical protein